MPHKVFVLDTSAVLRFLDKEAGYERVAEILVDAEHRRCTVLISAVNWGELICKLHQRRDAAIAAEICAQLTASGMQVLPATPQRAATSGHIKADLRIPYADCFGVQLAQESADRLLITADFDVMPAEHLIPIEFLPAKPKL